MVSVGGINIPNTYPDFCGSQLLVRLAVQSSSDFAKLTIQRHILAISSAATKLFARLFLYSSKFRREAVIRKKFALYSICLGAKMKERLCAKASHQFNVGS